MRDKSEAEGMVQDELEDPTHPTFLPPFIRGFPTVLMITKHFGRRCARATTTILDYFVLLPTNAQLFKKLTRSYTFRHYRVIFREPVINALPSYTSISNAAVGNTVSSTIKMLNTVFMQVLVL